MQCWLQLYLKYSRKAIAPSREFLAWMTQECDIATAKIKIKFFMTNLFYNMCTFKIVLSKIANINNIAIT